MGRREEEKDGGKRKERSERGEGRKAEKSKVRERESEK